MKRYATATIKAAGDGDDFDFEAVLSIPTLDRDGEIVDAKAFDPLPDHLTIDVDHAMSVEKTVASGTPFYEGDVLKFRGTFASSPLAQLTHGLVREGHIRTLSVAYMGARVETDEKDGRPHVRSAELLNAAFTPIAANREALVTAVKSMQADVAGKTPASSTSRALTDAGRERWGSDDVWVWCDDWDPDESWAVFDISADGEASRLVRVTFTRNDDGTVTLDAEETEVQRTVSYAPKHTTSPATEKRTPATFAAALIEADAAAALALL